MTFFTLNKGFHINLEKRTIKFYLGYFEPKLKNLPFDSAVLEEVELCIKNLLNPNIQKSDI